MQLPGLVPLGAKTEAIPATGRITRGRNQLRDSQSCLACMVMLVLLGRYWMFILYQRHRHCKMRHHAAHSPGTVAWGVHQIHGWQVDNTNILFVQRGEEHVPEVSRPEARCCQECDQSKQPLPTAHMQPPTSRVKCLHRPLSLFLSRASEALLCHLAYLPSLCGTFTRAREVEAYKHSASLCGRTNCARSGVTDRKQGQDRFTGPSSYLLRPCYCDCH